MSLHDDDNKLHEELCAYLFDEVDAERREAIEKALADSEELRAEKERLAATVSLVQGTLAGTPTLSEGARGRILTAATAAKASSAPVGVPRSWWSSGAVRAAASVTILAGGALAWAVLGSGGRTPAPAGEAREDRIAHLGTEPGSKRQGEDGRFGYKRREGLTGGLALDKDMGDSVGGRSFAEEEEGAGEFQDVRFSNEKPGNEGAARDRLAIGVGGGSGASDSYGAGAPAGPPGPPVDGAAGLASLDDVTDAESMGEWREPKAEADGRSRKQGGKRGAYAARSKELLSDAERTGDEAKDRSDELAVLSGELADESADPEARDRELRRVRSALEEVVAERPTDLDAKYAEILAETELFEEDLEEELETAAPAPVARRAAPAPQGVTGPTTPAPPATERLVDAPAEGLADGFMLGGLSAVRLESEGNELNPSGNPSAGFFYDDGPDGALMAHTAETLDFLSAYRQDYDVELFTSNTIAPSAGSDLVVYFATPGGSGGGGGGGALLAAQQPAVEPIRFNMLAGRRLRGGGEQVAALLRENVNADAWSVEGNGIAVGDDGRVVVEGTPELQLEVRNWVDDLNRATVEHETESLVEQWVADCVRRPGESPSDMFFRYWGDNAFEQTQLDKQSTFSIDVDTASYELARNYLSHGYLPQKEQVRTEEFVNAFIADVEPPHESTFRVEMDLAPSRFGEDGKEHWMLRVAVRGKDVAPTERRPLALTFVIDTSGSMKESGTIQGRIRMDLVKFGIRMMLAELHETDRIAIVAFSNEARLVLPETSLGARGVIEAAIDGLHPDGSTNAEAGIKLGYEQAALMLDEHSTNRVVLFSDGVANVGVTDQNRITQDVAGHRQKGIYLNTFGVGMDNHNDVFLEQLADKGDGICAYIDSDRQVKELFVERLMSLLEPIARDVKIQVEFDPRQVESYRQLGYENRAIADVDFRNDAVDAGEVGSGHQVTALYELTRLATIDEAPLATTFLRWKAPHGTPDEAEVMETMTPLYAAQASGTFEGTPAGYRRAVLVAQFAELLRRSVHARGDSIDELHEEMAKLDPELADPQFTELRDLVGRTKDLIRAQLPTQDELALALDSVRKNHYLRAQIQELERERTRAWMDELDRENERLEEQLRELLKARLAPPEIPEVDGQQADDARE